MATIPSESPNILVKEIDLAGQIPGVTTTTGAFVGEYSWGPANTPVLVGNEAQLAETFGAPGVDSAVTSRDFLTAAYFLKYSGSLYNVRAISAAAKNAVDNGTASAIPNRESFEQDPPATGNFHAKYPGTSGNSLAVKVCSGSTNFATFSSANPGLFNSAPGTSAFVTAAGGSEDELHIAVVDSAGSFSGTAGTVLESFSFLSAAKDAKAPDGSSNFAKTVINQQSQYVWCRTIAGVTGFDSSSAVIAGSATDANLDFGLVNGVTGTSPLYGTGYDQYNDGDTIQLDFLIAPGSDSTAAATTITNDLVSIAESPSRRDCVVTASPGLDDCIALDPASAVTAVNNCFDTFTRSNYLVGDNNWLKVYDKYRDQYVFIPASSSTAGIMAAGDLTADPWFSPAGQRRGRFLGVTSLAYNADKTGRDLLYRNGVNPVVNLPGQGVLLYGDKTFQSRPSAFDRINVRRLFLTMERAIKGAAQNVLFELNDEFTRAEFVNIVEPFLREIKGRRGITDFKVVCDETNNTPSVIDANRFVASVFVKPARSINYITLNFVAVRSGVEFEEVVGSV